MNHWYFVLASYALMLLLLAVDLLPPSLTLRTLRQRLKNRLRREQQKNDTMVKL